MRPWLLMFGGMIVWAIHFGGIYAIASVFDVISVADAFGSRLAIGALTLACLAADGALFVVTANRPNKHEGDVVLSWMVTVGALMAAISFVAVAWQGLPTLFG